MTADRTPQPAAPSDRDGLAEAFRRIISPPWDDRFALRTPEARVEACVLLAEAYSRQRYAPVLNIGPRRGSGRTAGAA